MLLICYPNCSTCKKAQQWLDENKLSYSYRHIQHDPPSVQELTQWVEKSNVPLKGFFNTSGTVYRTLQLKDRLPALSKEEQIALLASNGMLVKRPLLITENFLLVGFREKEWALAFAQSPPQTP